MVITRIWHGRTKTEHADEYLQFVIDTGVADYKSVEGNLSVEILLWRYAIGKGLTDPNVDRADLDHLTWRMAVLPLAGVGAILIGLIKPIFAGFAFLLIPLAHGVIGAKFRKAREKNSESTEEN